MTDQEGRFIFWHPSLRVFISARPNRFRRLMILFLILGFAALEVYGLEALKPYHLDKTLLTKAHYFLGGVFYVTSLSPRSPCSRTRRAKVGPGVRSRFFQFHRHSYRLR